MFKFLYRFKFVISCGDVLLIFPQLKHFWDCLSLNPPDVEIDVGGEVTLSSANRTEFFSAIEATREHLFLFLQTPKKILNIFNLFIRSTSTFSAGDNAKIELLVKACKFEDDSLMKKSVCFDWQDRKCLYENLEEMFCEQFRLRSNMTFMVFAKDILKCPPHREQDVANFISMRKVHDERYLQPFLQALNHMLKIKSNKIRDSVEFQEHINAPKLLQLRELTAAEKGTCKDKHLFCESGSHVFSQSSFSADKEYIMVATKKTTKEEVVFDVVFKKGEECPISKMLKESVFHFKSIQEKGQPIVTFSLTDYENLHVFPHNVSESILAQFYVPNSPIVSKPKLQKQLGPLGLAELSPHGQSVYICYAFAGQYVYGKSDVAKDEDSFAISFALTKEGFETQKIINGNAVDFSFLQSVFFQTDNLDAWNFFISWPTYFVDHPLYFGKPVGIGRDGFVDRIRFLNLIWHGLKSRHFCCHLEMFNPDQIMPVKSGLVKQLRANMLVAYSDFVKRHSQTPKDKIVKEVKFETDSAYYSLMFPTPLFNFTKSGELSEKQVIF